MLSIRDATKAFGPITVVERVSFDVRKGEVHALLGANGAGKSTLINILGGRFPDASGRVSLNGREIRLATPLSAIREGIAIVHQEADLVPDLSVSENVFLGHERGGEKGGVIRRIDRAAIAGLTRRLLDGYGMNIDPEVPVRHLSVAARQLVQIARALSRNAEVVIFDEPTARLGPNERELLFTIFDRLRAEGRMLVFVTHYLDEVIKVADRATVMRDGRRVDTVSVSGTNVAALSRMMVGDETASHRPARAPRDGGPAIDLGPADLPGFGAVSLRVGKGEIVGLLGHPGSGRHELSRSVVATLRRAKRTSVGFIPEDRRSEALFPFLSVGENITLGILTGQPVLAWRDHAREKRVAEGIITRFSLKCRDASQPAGELSGGNQQKAVFGRATIRRPEVYVIECPTVGVDVKAAREIHQVIHELAAAGAGVILATDDLDEALALSDRLLVMFRNRIATEFDAATATRAALIAAMGAAEEVAHG